MVRVFGHYFTVPVIALAVIETALWLSIVGTLFEVGMSTGTMPSLRGGSPVTPFVLAVALFIFVFSAFGLYNRDVFLDIRVFLQRATIAFAILLAFGGVAVVVFRTSPVDSAEYLTLIFVAVLVQLAICSSLRLLFLSFNGSDILKRRILIIGDGSLVEHLSAAIFSRPVGHLSLAGVLAPPREIDWSQGFRARLAALLSTGHVDEIVFAGPDSSASPIDHLLREAINGVRVTDYRTFFERETGRIDLDGAKRDLVLPKKWGPTHVIHQMLKRMIDLSGAASLMLFTMPLILITAVFIKLESPGPVFYRQERVGRNGRTFVIFKFRSMRGDAEVGGPQWASANDSRITRVGRIIRKFRIDELPQLINVLRGEMSLVGPRPERPYFDDQLRDAIPQWQMRHAVKPGVTGWAQVNCGYGCDLEGAKMKLAYDLYYVKNESLFLDLIILFQTVRVVAMREGAH